MMKPRSTRTYWPTLTPGATRVETVVNWPSANSTSATDPRRAVTREGRMRHTSVRLRILFHGHSKSMHELALARTIVDQILKVLEHERLGHVSRVVLELGTAAGVEADA